MDDTRQFRSIDRATDLWVEVATAVEVVKDERLIRVTDSDCREVILEAGAFMTKFDCWDLNLSTPIEFCKFSSARLLRDLLKKKLPLNPFAEMLMPDAVPMEMY